MTCAIPSPPALYIQNNIRIYTSQPYWPDLPDEPFLHHALLELPAFAQPDFQHGDPSVHVAHDGSDGGLLGFGWQEGGRAVSGY